MEKSDLSRPSCVELVFVNAGKHWLNMKTGVENHGVQMAGSSWKVFKVLSHPPTTMHSKSLSVNHCLQIAYINRVSQMKNDRVEVSCVSTIEH